MDACGIVNRDGLSTAVRRRTGMEDMTMAVNVIEPAAARKST
jgi:hypothetical protein